MRKCDTCDDSLFLFCREQASDQKTAVLKLPEEETYKSWGSATPNENTEDRRGVNMAPLLIYLNMKF